MSKKSIKMHQKGVSTRLYQAGRMEANVKSFGNKQVRKAKKSK